MHLVFVIAPGGGPEANVKTLAPELEKRGHRLSVIYTVAKEQVDINWSASIGVRFAPPASAHYYAAKFVGSYHAWPLRLRSWEQARAVVRALAEIEREAPIDIVEVTEGFSVASLKGRWRVVVRAQGSDSSVWLSSIGSFLEPNELRRLVPNLRNTCASHCGSQATLKLFRTVLTPLSFHQIPTHK